MRRRDLEGGGNGEELGGLLLGYKGWELVSLGRVFSRFFLTIGWNFVRMGKWKCAWLERKKKGRFFWL
jgi:hypothetical protein